MGDDLKKSSPVFFVIVVFDVAEVRRLPFYYSLLSVASSVSGSLLVCDALSLKR